MQEYVGQAVVLAHEPHGDLDGRVSLFTKRHGKLIAKAKSVRRITSKLRGHLDVGNVVSARLIEKNGLQVVDALKHVRLAALPASFYYLDSLLHEAEPDLALWSALTRETFEWKDILRILGWDPAHALCAKCGKGEPAYFLLRSQEFFCAPCGESFRNGTNEVVLLGNA